MNAILPNNYRSHAIASSAAVALHLALIFIICSSALSTIKAQTIRVSLVSISSQNQKKSEKDFKKTIPLEKDFALARKQNAKSQEEVKSQTASTNQKTTGKQSKDATETNSAQTEPVFDAAYLNNPSPYYPESARSRNIQGKVLLEVLVKKDGLPAQVRVAHSSGSSALDMAALDAVKRWKFIPANRNNEPVEAKVIVPVEFKLS